MDHKTPEVTQLPAKPARGVRRPMVSRPEPVLIEVQVAPLSHAPAARPWEARGSIDVEQLAVWAFRDQRAHRVAGRGLHGIEAAVSGLEPRGRSADGCAAIADIQHMGCRVDWGGATVKDHVHPAAELLEQLVACMQDGGLVRHYALLGGRPEGWREPARWYRPVVWDKPGEEAGWEWTNEGRGARGYRMCRVVPTITHQELRAQRQLYARWLDALGVLAWELSMHALGFAVTGPSAPARPWDQAVRP
jgi:hypothetical protein